jgi:hypothetical protein
MNAFPLRELVLYKHGVGFFVREGSVSGTQVELTFHRDEINDVLKSLTVLDKSGGQVLGIHYQTPPERDALHADSSIHLSEYSTLRDLLRDLRGRRVSLTVETGTSTPETLTGTVIGIDDPNAVNAIPELSRFISKATITLKLDSGGIRVFPVESLHTLNILDERAAHDLEFVLNLSKAEETRQTVSVSLSEGEHQLVAHYVAPSPTWRVSYRVVAESDVDKSTGKALLQAWGLFDNLLDEDLADVKVTFVAGQPISFVYDLKSSRIPQRPTVQDESRIAPGPVQFAAGMSAPGAPSPANEDAFANMEPMAWMEDVARKEDARFGGGALLRRIDRPQAAKAVAVNTTGKESGEFFQYDVTTPVSVKRGQSALVPIISAEVGYSRELLYNRAKLPDHPVAALRFKNTTGLTLERGPVTLIEDDSYRGEAVVPFTRRDNDIYLPYAVELGVSVTERQNNYQQTTGLHLKGRYLLIDEYSVFRTTYILENKTAQPVTVTIEAPILPEHELFEMPAPDVETASERRWKVTVDAHDSRYWTRQERMLVRREQQLFSITAKGLQWYFEKNLLDAATFEKLSQLLALQERINTARAEINNLTAQRKEVHDQQEQLRRNLGALARNSEEAPLRNRILGQLESTQDKLDHIEQRITALQQQIAADEAQIEAEVQTLGEG